MPHLKAVLVPKSLPPDSSAFSLGRQLTHHGPHAWPPGQEADPPGLPFPLLIPPNYLLIFPLK